MISWALIRKYFLWHNLWGFLWAQIEKSCGFTQNLLHEHKEQVVIYSPLNILSSQKPDQNFTKKLVGRVRADILKWKFSVCEVFCEVFCDILFEEVIWSQLLSTLQSFTLMLIKPSLQSLQQVQQLLVRSSHLRNTICRRSALPAASDKLTAQSVSRPFRIGMMINVPILCELSA